MDDDNKDTETLLMNLVAANYELGDILHQLFKMMVLEHHNRSVSTTNPDAALAEILGNASKKELRFLKSLKQEINTEKFYDTRNVPYKFKTLICIDELDVTCIVEILKHINGFKTNKKALKGKKCAKIGKGHVKCCVNCVHTCKYCGKTSCSPDCDAADVDHKCLNNTCNQGKIECNKNNTVCCPTCGLCWKCGQMLPRGKQCPILILCISIEIIHHLRNMFSHISPIDYTLFLSKKSTLPYFPKCNTWSELSKELKVAGENILSFMSNPCQFSRTDPLSEDDKFERSYQLRLTLGNKATLMEKCTDKIAKSMLKLQATEITNDLKQHLSDLLEKFEVSVKKIMEKEFKKFKENEETDNVFKRESALNNASQALRNFYIGEHSMIPKTPIIRKWINQDVLREDIIVDVTLSEIHRTSGNRQHEYDVSNDDNQSCVDRIFDDKRKYTIISGAPGVGKSTLVDTLLLRWASNDIWNGTNGMPNFRFVFVLPCRNINKFNVKKFVTLEDLLKDQYRKEFQTMKMEDLDACKEDILLIIEGFDEFSEYDDFKDLNEDRKNSTTALCQFFYDILDPRGSYRTFYKLVTSRPLAHDEILKKFKYSNKIKNLIITGFSDESKKLFIKKYFSEDENKASITEKKIEESRQLSSLASRPFFCCVYCSLVADSKDSKFPETYTSIYGSIVLLYLRNHGKKNTNDLWQFVGAEDVKQTILHISEIAYQTLRSRKIQFRKEDIENQDISLQTLINSSGLIENLNGGDFDNGYFQFTHQIFHEFMAALHVFYNNIPIIPSNRDDKISFSKSSILLFLAGFYGYCNAKLKNEASWAEQAVGLLTNLRNNKSDFGNKEFCKLVTDAEIFINERSELFYGMIFEYKNELKQLPTTKSLVLPPPDHALSSYDVICIQNMFEKIKTATKVKLPFKNLSIDIKRLDHGMFQLFYPYFQHLQSLCLLSYDGQYLKVLSKHIPLIQSVVLPHCGLSDNDWETISNQIAERHKKNTLKLRRFCVRDKLEQMMGEYLWDVEHAQCIEASMYRNIVFIEEAAIEIDEDRLSTLCQSISKAKAVQSLQLKSLELKVRSIETFKEFCECFHYFRSMTKIQLLLSTTCQHNVEEKRRSKKQQYKGNWLFQKKHGDLSYNEIDEIIVCKKCRIDVEEEIDKIIAVPKKGKAFQFKISVLKHKIFNGQADFYWQLIFTPV